MILYFKNPVFNTEQNTSVRRGIKWAIEQPDSLGIPIMETGKSDILGYAYDVTCAIKRFCDLTDADIAHEHDDKCRTQEGLLQVMREVYPDFYDTEIVTVLNFKFRKI